MLMKVKIEHKINSKSDLLIIPVFSDQIKKINSDYPATIKDFIKKRFAEKDFSAKKGEELFSYVESKVTPKKLLVMGMGESNKFDFARARELGAKMAKSAKRHKIKSLNVMVSDEMEAAFEELVEGILMPQYSVAKFKSNKKKKNDGLELLEFTTKSKSKNLDDLLKKAELIVHAVDYVKDLVNAPANIVDTEYLAAEAKKIAKQNGYKIVVMGNKELKKMKAGGILTVNNGSKDEAKLIVLQYDGGKKNEKPIVLVGKGVVFDTGGYNLKPSGGMETMQQDMGGGATVLGVFEVLKKLGIKRNVIGIVPAVSNMVSEKAYRPSDIITMLNGKTVEITNTDAEGRIILADALHYATELDPAEIISIATLTGAVAVALGDRYCGVMGNDKKLTDKLQQAGDEVDELVWPLPIHNDYKKKVDSDVADYKNHDLGSGRYGGTAKAAAFLEKFVNKNTWAHLDIGGTAFTTDPMEYQQKGATAHGLRIFLRYLES